MSTLLHTSEFFDNVRFINDVKNLTAIWDSRTPAYTNKLEKTAAWTSLCRKYDTAFDSKSLAEKNDIGICLQRRWKSLRTCYARELGKLKRSNGEYPRHRRQYLYFKYLDFLAPVSTTSKELACESNENQYLQEEITASTVNEARSVEKDQLLIPDQQLYYNEETKDEYHTNSCNSHPEEEKEENSIISSNKNKRPKTVLKFQDLPSLPSTTRSYECTNLQPNTDLAKSTDTDGNSEDEINPNKRKLNEYEDKLFKVLSKSISMKEAEKSEKEDEDRLFLLSLVSDMKQVPKEVKLELKSEIINAILKYKRLYKEKSQIKSTTNDGMGHSSSAFNVPIPAVDSDSLLGFYDEPNV